MTCSTPRLTMAFILFAILFAILFSVVSAAPVRLPTCPVVLPTHATPRIVGGDEASPHTRSHIVSFYEEGCGGSLLSDTWVLTAAHCLIHDRSIARISGTNSSNGVEIPVKRVIVHPDYQFPKDDVALIELESAAPSSASFVAVNSNMDVPEDGEFARVAGYGFQEEGFDHDHDAVLRQVDVPVMSTQKCIERYFSVHSYLREDISAEKHICAGYDGGGCDSCTADSGGPLFVYDDENRPVQIAIVSFGYGCAREVPGGYTRVSTYVPWMNSVGATFDEKTSRKALFGDTVSGASDSDADDEGEEEPTNENTSEPAPELPAVPSPEAVTGPGPPTPSNPISPEPPADSPSEPDSETKPISEDSPSSESKPNSGGNPTDPSPSPKPSPPARLPPNQAVSNPSTNERPTTDGSQGGHGGEGRPRPGASGSESSIEGDDTVSATGSGGGNDNGAGQIGDDSGDSGAEAAYTEADSAADEITEEEKEDDDSASEETPESVSTSIPQNIASIGPTPNDSDGAYNGGNTQGESDAKEPTNGSDSASPGPGSGNTVGPIFVSEPSQEVVLPSSQMDSEDLEELDSSSSPEVEVSESPEDANANSETADIDDGGLGGLQIAMIVVGVVLGVVAGGYLIYFIMEKVMK